MKILLTFILSALMFNFASARFGGSHASHSSHSSSHSFGSHSHSSSHSSFHSSGHTTTHHISHGTPHSNVKVTTRSYTRVTRVQPHEIHSYPSGNHFLYYYLLFNHNSHTYDTISSNSQADLQTQVQEISDVDDTPMSNGEMFLISVVVIIVIVGVLYAVTR